MTYINREMISRYVENCLPNEDLSLFPVEAVVDDLLASDPNLVGDMRPYPTQEDEEQARAKVDKVAAYLDFWIAPDLFWKFVENHARLTR